MPAFTPTLAAIAAANGGHQLGYGADVYTTRLAHLLADHFGEGVEAFPVFNGTGANVAGLQSMLPRWGPWSARQTAHIHTDEGGASGTGQRTEVPDGRHP